MPPSWRTRGSVHAQSNRIRKHQTGDGRGDPLSESESRAFQGLLQADGAEEFMGAAPPVAIGLGCGPHDRTVLSGLYSLNAWRVRVYGALYDAWRACPMMHGERVPGLRPHTNGAAAPLSGTDRDAPPLSDADLWGSPPGPSAAVVWARGRPGRRTVTLCTLCMLCTLCTLWMGRPARALALGCVPRGHVAQSRSPWWHARGLWVPG